MRVNNLEVVGVPEAENPGDPIENTLVQIFNSLPGLHDSPITADDIGICHPIPSERRDNKIVAVCKFVSRKTKHRILEVKKDCRDLKFRNNTIYINEHLSPFNRRLFAHPSTKKRELDLNFY